MENLGVVPEYIDTNGSLTNSRERVEGLEVKVHSKEMDILRDLPCYNSSNFSKLLSHNNSATSIHSKYNSVSFNLTRGAKCEMVLQYSIKPSPT